MTQDKFEWLPPNRAPFPPIYIISESLGYNNDTATQQYLASLNQTTADEANSMILGDVVGSYK